MRRVLFFAAPFVLCGLLVTACSSDPEPAPSPTPEPTISTPSPTAAPATEPTVAFAGDCENVLSLGEAASVLSALGPLTSEVDTFDDRFAQPRPLQTIGGLWCQWHASNEAGTGFAVRILTFPLAVVPVELVESTAAVGCHVGDGLGCRVSTSSGDAWVLVQAVSESSIDIESIQQQLLMALDLAAERAPSFAAPVAVARSDAWWRVTDCAAVAEQLGVGELLGEYQDGIPSDRTRHGWDQILEAAGVQLKCEWSTTVNDGRGGRIGAVVVSIEPGSGWSPRSLEAEQVTSSPILTEEASVVGATGATTWWTEARDMDGTIVDDGINVFEITLWGNPAMDSVPSAQRLLDALAATR